MNECPVERHPPRAIDGGDLLRHLDQRSGRTCVCSTTSDSLLTIAVELSRGISSPRGGAVVVISKRCVGWGLGESERTCPCRPRQPRCLFFWSGKGLIFERDATNVEGCHLDWRQLCIMGNILFRGAVQGGRNSTWNIRKHANIFEVIRNREHLTV